MMQPVSEDEPALPTAVAVAGVVVWCLVAGLSAVLEVLLIPVYIGRFIFPIAVVIALVANIAIPRLAHQVLDSGWAVLLPMVVWVLTVIWLAFFNTSHGSVLVPGAGDDEYVGLAIFFGGTLAAAIGVLYENSRSR
jgi:hypothetical protein